MGKTMWLSATVTGLVIATLAETFPALGADASDQEIALLKQQLRLMEAKFDKLQKQTAANTAAAANANAKADAKASPVLREALAYPIKSAAPPADAVVHMANNRPTI